MTTKKPPTIKPANIIPEATLHLFASDLDTFFKEDASGLDSERRVKKVAVLVRKWLPKLRGLE